MELKKLNTILNAFEATSAKEITLESKSVKLHMVRSNAPSSAQQVSEKSSEVTPKRLQQQKQNETDIISSHVGYFSRFDPKEKKQIVKLRDVVKAGDMVAIIKAAHIEHKQFSKISGKITEFLVEEGQPVEYGQPIIRLEKI